MNKKTPLIASSVASTVLLLALSTAGGLAISGGSMLCYWHYQERQEKKRIRDNFEYFCNNKDIIAKIESLDDTYHVKKYFCVVKEFAKNPNTKKLVGKRTEDGHWEFKIVNPQDKKLDKDDKSALRKENWEAVDQFMEEAKHLILYLQSSLREPVATDKDANIFYRFDKIFGSRISKLGDEYSYVKDSYKAVKEFYNFPSVKKLIKVSVPGKNGNRWEFKAVGRSDDLSEYDGKQLLTDWQAAESFVCTTAPIIISHDDIIGMSDTWRYALRFNLLDHLNGSRFMKQKFAHLKESFEAAKQFMNNPESKRLIRISVKDKNDVHDHWEFKLIDRDSDLSGYDGNGFPLLIDHCALDNFVDYANAFAVFFSNCEDYKGKVCTGLLSNTLHNRGNISKCCFWSSCSFESALKDNFDQVCIYLKDPKNKTLIQMPPDKSDKSHKVFKAIDRNAVPKEYNSLPKDFDALENYVNNIAGCFVPGAY